MARDDRLRPLEKMCDASPNDRVDHELAADKPAGDTSVHGVAVTSRIRKQGGDRGGRRFSEPDGF